jgi:hypothetical protein
LAQLVLFKLALAERESGVVLDDLNTAFAIYSPGHMVETKCVVAVYLDKRAVEAQRNALTQIFTGQAGGHPAKFAAHDDITGVGGVGNAVRC